MLVLMAVLAFDYHRQDLIDRNTLGGTDLLTVLIRENFKGIRVLIVGLGVGYSTYLLLVELPTYLVSRCRAFLVKRRIIINGHDGD